jgi:uncharacterized protein YjbI with pentapeptide repeats
MRAALALLFLWLLAISARAADSAKIHSSANFTGVSFKGAELSGADLAGAKIETALGKRH